MGWVLGELVAGAAEDFLLEVGDVGVELHVLHVAQLGFNPVDLRL